MTQKFESKLLAESEKFIEESKSPKKRPRDITFVPARKLTPLIIERRPLSFRPRYHVPRT